MGDGAAGSEALKQAIVARIRAEGPIPFRDFMEVALYHPEHGYYNRRREVLGREGDFVTSPEVSPYFAVCVGRQLREMWQVLGAPARFDLVEAGAGTGELARGILHWARRHAGDFHAAVAYTIVEVSETLASRQRAALAVEGEAARWGRDLPEGMLGCVLSNELYDAFPVHRVEVRGGALRELFVAWDGERFVEEPREPSTPELEAYFRALALLPGEGCRAEVNLAAPAFVRRAAAALARGFILSIDYGYEAKDLYAPRHKDGTLMGYYRHAPAVDPFARLGRQDITSHVDFTTLRRAGEEAGLETVGTITQARFLANLGLERALALPPEQDGDLAEHHARRRIVAELLDPQGLGRHLVLAQGKGVGAPRLAGFA